MLPARDAELVQLADAALADATERGGAWLSCRPGCTPCCHGVFRISALDAERLHVGLDALEPGRASAVRSRARAAVETSKASYPGDPATGILYEEDERWETFADLPETDAPCPALDPATGRCELYAARPLTCRIFGPPVMNEGGLGVCELCYVGASEHELLAGEMHLNHQKLEAELDAELSKKDETIIAYALLGSQA